MADEQDQDPMAGMFPPDDNPEYHRKKAEFEEAQGAKAGDAAMAQHPYMAERTQGQRVRKNPPQAATPVTPPPRPEQIPPEGTGLEVDPNLATRYQQEEAPATAPVAPLPPVPAAAPVIEKTHPLLQRLRRDFGIEAIPLEEVKIGTHVFTLRVLDGSAVTTAVRFADAMSIGTRENELNLQTCLTAFSVVAVDGEPLWKMFDIPLEHDERVFVEGQWKPVFAPNSPPDRVRIMASTRFMDFLSKEATMELMTELWTTYKEKVDPKGSLASLLGDTESGEDSEDIPLP
jgi:hypothetical protein